MKIFFGSSISLEQRESFRNSRFFLSNNTANDQISDKLIIDRFSDGEILPMFKESIRGEDIFLIQSPTTHDFIFETALIIDAAKRAGCNSITLVAPYLPYSRQDKIDHLRASIGSKALAVMLEAVGLDRLITIDLHASAIQGFYNIPVIHLNGNKIFIDYISKLGLDNICFVAPDQGAVKRASDYCKAFPESTLAMINKRRTKPNEVHSMELVGDVSGKNVIVVDDMADTLGTMKKAANLLIEKGALSVIGICTHGVLSGSAIKNLQESHITKLFVSDSIQNKNMIDQTNKLQYVSCSDLITRSIIVLNQHKSIHQINEI